jgi:hypothetical protein
MGRILENWRITLATLFSLMLIVGAFILAREAANPSVAQASTETALLKAIATKDSTGDGLPDWEKSLYGIPVNATTTDYFNLGMTDGEAVAKGLIVPKAIADITVATSSPDITNDTGDDSLPPPPADNTLTAAFSKNFITLYMAAKEENGDTPLSEDDISNISNEVMNSLASSVTTAPDFKSAGDMKVSGSGPDALRAFAISAEAVFVANTSNATTSEINYLQDAVENNDTSAISHLVSIAKMYRNSAVGLAVLPVPQELANDNLALVNAMMHISEITSDFARVNDDPLAAMLALDQYSQAVLNLQNTFIDIGNIYNTDDISLPTGAPGASFVNLISTMEAKEQTASSTTL